MGIKKEWIQTLGILLGITASVSTVAQNAGLDLAKSKACMACHQVETKRVGPPLASIAQRYAGGGPEATEYLMGKIRLGGRGAWGAVPMPAQPHLKEAEARELAQWILTLNPTN